MSLLDIEDNRYPDDNFWLEHGFVDVKRQGLWITAYKKHLHWDLPGYGTRWGNVTIYIEYRKYGKELIIIQHSHSFYYDEVDFEPIKLYRPTQREIEMVLNEEFLSSRLTYKHK